MSRSRNWFSFLTFVASLSVAGWTCQRIPAADGDTSGRFWVENAPAATAAAQVQLPTFAPLVKAVGPAVVNISSTKMVDAPAGHPRFPGMDEDFFRRFFGGPGMGPGEEDEQSGPQGEPEQFSARSLGSGFVITSDGYIVTNNHVIEGATDITVRFQDATEYTAKIIGRDPATDIALIKVEPTKGPLTTVSLGDSDNLVPGDWVVAIGNPFSLDHSVSVGIISAKARRSGLVRLEDFLQTDASINPGNSGGPLFNLKGEVIGVNTAIIGNANGIGFAVPINLAKEVLPDLKRDGRPIRGYLGVQIQAVDASMAAALGIKEAEGALVAEVQPNSPAEKIGIKRQDVIIEFDGHAVKKQDELPRLVARVKPGAKAKIVWMRDGKRQSATVTVAEFQEQGLAKAEAPMSAPRGDEKRYGLVVAPTSKVPGDSGVTSGVTVVDVKAGTPAEEAGLMRGDVIVEVNRKKVEGLDDFRAALKGAPSSRPVLLLIQRRGGSVFVPLAHPK